MILRNIAISMASVFLANSIFAASKDIKLAKNQVLNIGNLDDPKTLDPQKCNESTCSAIVRQLFEGLVTTDLKENIIPAAAESWKISADGKKYVFTLKKDLKWSDGTKLTAKDFVFAFQRLVDPKIASDQASLLEFVINGKEITEGKKTPQTLGVKAINDVTLEIELIKPIPSFLENLTVPNTSPVQISNLEKYKDSFTQVNNLVSNGPYKLIYRKFGDKVTVEKNPLYWNNKEILIDKVNFHSITDQNSEFSMYETGQLDITGTIPINKFKQIKAKYGSELSNHPYLASYVYIFNTQKAPLNNKKLRQALSIAIDREIIANSVMGQGQRALYDLIPYGLKNYSQNKLYWQDWPRAKQIEEAKKLYREAGYSPSNILTIHILYNTNEAHKKIASSIASMWKNNLGVNVVTVNEEWKTMLDKRTNGDFEVLRLGNIANINDATDFLAPYRSFDPSNDPKYKNPEYDNIVNQALQEMNPQKRKELLENASKIITEDAPIAPIYSYTSAFLKKPYVVGFQKNSMDKYSLKGVYLEERKIN
ncbi:oligopeptide ABC transporter substrate-binding protein OppA [Silvanigrella paludirubra]|uniref:Oligopeptide ABC transporter substrate-binding protein OppA n=1 Tax=Silvanigrella paludirubra TaxID=2499159 RepID=A0A6N6VN20_9BACT|nr:peptide ABC transporter substrate-binding protein [Silvanigrella paludirubra]KAB8036078.1 oligopeptide ABC transporter substrate-binding protein OppA [Silvanigrella paludirubra]